ncbi:HNH endonuclease signature motif containing protein [Streptomyces yaizuensis]|uniref:HNH endonuclease n=1 Tax=Streptomyces yaizuensis TaxID=2989713 RepID=A0ABQ5NU18_9ACTN|nr:HNH endonuclease [Streptomyces sp. YSPA8]GLF93501.1 HNH endonuclease [Streptomyces sp. YSPA8]
MSRGERYTRELLAEAARRCGSIDEVIAFFGTPPYGHLRRYLLRRFRHFGIDVSHFARRPYRTSGPRPSRAELSAAIESSRSLAEALRRLGRPDTSHQRALLRAHAQEESLSTAHFLGQAHQRGRPGPTPVRRPAEVLVKTDTGRRTPAHLLRRALREIGVPEQCAGCGSGPVWHGRPMTLEVDHINADWKDNQPHNLRLLCPNCHAITDTWCRGGNRQRKQG